MKNNNYFEVILTLNWVFGRATEPRVQHIESGWDSYRIITSHSLIGSLGGKEVTLSFKSRQLGNGPKARWLKGLSFEISRLLFLSILICK
jgi:hypothetical protein